MKPPKMELYSSAQNQRLGWLAGVVDARASVVITVDEDGNFNERRINLTMPDVELLTLFSRELTWLGVEHTVSQSQGRGYLYVRKVESVRKLLDCLPIMREDLEDSICELLNSYLN